MLAESGKNFHCKQGNWNENCLHSTAQLIIILQFASANEQLDNGMQTQSTRYIVGLIMASML